MDGEIEDRIMFPLRDKRRKEDLNSMCLYELLGTILANS